MPDEHELTEEEALELALQDHPQWSEQWRDDSLPEEIAGEDGEPMNPRLHIIMHTIIERQLATDDPTGISAVGQQLEQLGVSRHNVRHEIARALVNQIWLMQTDGRAFDVAEYFDDLEQIVSEHRQASR